MKPGDLMRVKLDQNPAVPWATPGSVVEIVRWTNKYYLYARLVFGDYRDSEIVEYARLYNGDLLFERNELEALNEQDPREVPEQ